MELKIEYESVENLREYENNAKIHTKEQVEQIKKSIKEFGMNDPIAVWKENEIIEGHGRLLACKELGIEEVPVIRLDNLTDEQRRAYMNVHNQLTMNTGFNMEMLQDELEAITSIDMSQFGFDFSELEEIKTEDVEEDLFDEEIPEEPETKLGDIYILGNHRLICGDSTDPLVIDKLMSGAKADMVFTDPPYGMKKEKDGVLNDNLNYDDLLQFNKEWIPLTFGALKDNGSWYCWGIDEPLMDIYSNILKPMQKENKITFRNLITWNKSYLENGNTFNPFGASGSKELRSYPTADEKCLFVMCGVQGFNNNSDNYFEEYEPIRKYLETEAEKAGIDAKKLKEICGVGMFSHWFTKSQWDLMKEGHYRKIQEYCIKNNINAFGVEFGQIKKQYEEIKKQYEEIKKQYEEIKKQFYDSRAYFENADHSNNVWNIEITKGKEKQEAGGHATPKPIALCSRAIKSSSRQNEIVLDVFGGSGSTMIACEQLDRKCYMVELDERYCDVIVKRWEKYTGQKAERI